MKSEIQPSFGNSQYPAPSFKGCCYNSLKDSSCDGNLSVVLYVGENSSSLFY